MIPQVQLDRLPGDWWNVGGTSQADDLKAELQRELPERHVLSGVTVEAIAVRRHPKDVLFWLPQEREWAWVHLTYRSEKDPRWPSTFIAADIQSVIAELTE